MKHGLTLLLALGLACQVHAQEISPGLWEISAEMKIGGSTIPPSKFNQCYTAKDIAAGKQYGANDNKKCVIANLKNTNGQVSYDISCPMQGSQMTGSVKGTTSPTSFNLEQKTRMPPDRGGGEMNSIIKGRRVGDCTQ